MLARKYDSYAWEEQQYEEVQQPQRHKKINTDPYRQLRNRFMIFAVVVLATYLLSVVRSEAMVNYGSQLVSLRKQETQLINKNNELKIEVEQLKGPERIISLAEMDSRCFGITFLIRTFPSVAAAATIYVPASIWSGKIRHKR